MTDDKKRQNSSWTDDQSMSEEYQGDKGGTSEVTQDQSQDQTEIGQGNVSDDISTTLDFESDVEETDETEPTEEKVM